VKAVGKDRNGTTLYTLELTTLSPETSFGFRGRGIIAMNRITVMFALAGLALFTGCSDSPTGPGPEQYAGVWTGTTGAGREVRMVVSDVGVVDSLSIRVRLSVGLGSCTGPLLLDEPVQITGDSYSAQATFPGSNITTSVTGSFSSASAVTGTHGSFSGSFQLVCGGSYIIGTGSPLSSGTWEATK